MSSLTRLIASHLFALWLNKDESGALHGCVLEMAAGNSGIVYTVFPLFDMHTSFPLVVPFLTTST